MKKIKYIQDYVCGKAGEVKEVHDITAANLVAIGVAEYVEEDEKSNEQLQSIEIKENNKHKKN